MNYTTVVPLISLVVVFVVTMALIRYFRGFYKAQEKEREANERIKLMFDGTPLFVQYWTKDYLVVDCNKYISKAYGYSTKEEYIAYMKSRRDEFFAVREGRVPNTNPEAMEIALRWTQHIDTAFRRGYTSFEYMDIKPDGTTMYTEEVAIRMIYHGEPVVITYAKDVTSLVVARQELEYREDMVNVIKNTAILLLNSETAFFGQHLTQSMQIIAEALKVQGVHLWKNHLVDGKLYASLEFIVSSHEPAFNAGTLYSYSDIVPSWENILKNGIYINNVVRQMPQKEKEYLSKTGLLSIFAAPVFIKGEFWGFVGFDDHEKERFFTKDEQSVLHSASLLIANAFILNEMIQNLHDTSKELEQANKAKSNFLAQMSHEIRTPMNAVIGVTESQLQKGNLDPEYKSALDKIYNAGNTLLNIINDILDVSKIDAIKIELNPEKYEVASLIYNVANMNSVRFSSKPIEFKLNVSEHIPRTLVGDELRIKQVLNNVLSNAFKYTDKGKIEFSVYSSHDELAGADDKANRDCGFLLVLVVSDTGVGMTKEETDKIFDEYSRFNLRANRATQGTGLGMYIAHKFLMMMGGEINVASEVGKGTIITMRLPQGDIGAEPLGKEMAEKLERFRENNLADSRMVFTHTPMPYGSVLVVDDDEMNLFVANALLNPYELSIETANSGPAAIEKIKSGKVYDVVFMDYMMPEMDGIEATKIIRDLGYSQPVIALTADAVTGRAEMFLESGFNAFISKPIDMRQMDVVLKKFIRDKQPHDNIFPLDKI